MSTLETVETVDLVHAFLIQIFGASGSAVGKLSQRGLAKSCGR